MAVAELERVLAAVDAALRQTFPHDFDTRCMYAAFGVRDLLRAAGERAQIIAGDFLCFSVSRDGRSALMEGFGKMDANPPAHFWVEAAGRRLDLGPHYLPRRSRMEVAAIPPVCWSLGSPLPHYARYRERQRFDFDVELSPADPLVERLREFRSICAQQPAASPHWRWMLRSQGSVTAAARDGDTWAKNALLFLKCTTVGQLPI